MAPLELQERTAKAVNIPKSKVSKALQLLVDDGHTIPFVTRYRKDATGNLNEQQLRQTAHRALASKTDGTSSPRAY